MVTYVKSDLDFILAQIKIAEAHASGADLTTLIPHYSLPYGLRTVDGTFNNLLPGQSDFGAADTLFPRLVNPVFRNDADGDTMPLGPPGAPVVTNNNYDPTIPLVPGPVHSHSVADADPRIISNLIVDQTLNNPAAIGAALKYAGSENVIADTQAIILAAQVVADARANAIPTSAELAALLQASDDAAALAALRAGEEATAQGIKDAAQIEFDIAQTAYNDAVIATDTASALAQAQFNSLLQGGATLAEALSDPIFLALSQNTVDAQALEDAALIVRDAEAAELAVTVAALNAAIAASNSADADAATALATYNAALNADIESDPAVIAAELALATLVEGWGIVGDNGNLIIPNVATDEGLSASFNSWFTLFGQFFDHGLDLVTKGGNGTVYIPLQPDDPLITVGPDGIANTGDEVTDPAFQFMTLTRATTFVDPVTGLTTETRNTTTPFVDQNQTYTSHPSHQAFLREYVLNAAGDPVATGKLLEGSDGSGLANWGEVKAQAQALLGINLTDADVGNVPLLRTDAYGKFIPGPNGFPQVVIGLGDDGVPNTADDLVIEGDPTANGGLGISLASAVRTEHAFLDDIAHNAAPGTVFDTDGNPATPETSVVQPDADGDAGNAIATDFRGRKIAYDDELLDLHKVTGDGRGNENIGLTSVHHVFHAEHNRLVDHTKDVVLATADLAFINEWLLDPIAALPTSQAEIDALIWDGERVFQSAKFGTEMQYQHLVFEEFARKVQPLVNLFGPYDAEINPAIVAEFAHVVYRFGHSMLTETVARMNPDGTTNDIGLIEAFLNPVEFDAAGTDEESAGAVIRGMTRQLGNEIDEFVVGALRNNLLGLPLDLATINMARARDTGVPTLNAARRDFYEGTGDSQLKPYDSWVEFAQHVKNPLSVVNFIAAYGTHELVTAETTIEGKRAAATAIVFGTTERVIGNPDDAGDDRTIAAPLDRIAFLNSTGAYALVGGLTTSGLEAIDLWIGGLAEAQQPFGGLLGSTFNFVFETQLEKLQDSDRFYYLARTAGLHFLTELEGNSFAELVTRNTDLDADGMHLPGDIFSVPNWILEVDQTKQVTGIFRPDQLDVDGNPLPGQVGREDPIDSSNPFVELVIRDNPATLGPDTHYLQYTGPDHVVLGGTALDDTLIASIGDDTVWGDEGNDRIEGGAGVDQLIGGDGDDIITDINGDDNIKGQGGNDVVNSGDGFDLIILGDGNDFSVGGEDANETFGGEGNDYIFAGDDADVVFGDGGDDWIEGGQGNDLLQGDFGAPFQDSAHAGNDVIRGGPGGDDYDSESGDDIMLADDGIERNEGMLGFDWVSYKYDEQPADADFFFTGLLPPDLDAIRDRFDMVEGLSGWDFNDVLRGDNADTVLLSNIDVVSGHNNAINNQAQIDLVAGLQGLLGAGVTTFSGGNIILGGGGSDIIEGRGGDDIIDGDAKLNVRLSIRTGLDGTGVEIGTADSMTLPISSPDAALNGLSISELMFSGALNPGQLQIAREIITDDISGVDTAVFSGSRADYTISVADPDGFITISHNDPVLGVGLGVDGVDRVRNVERLQFADQTVELVGGLNELPVGAPSITALLGFFQAGLPVGVTLNLDGSLAGVTDANNPNAGLITAFTVNWQIEQTPGAGDWIPLVDAVTGLPITGNTIIPSGDPLVGIDGVRVRAAVTYVDGAGLVETVVSAPSAPLDPATNLVDTPADDLLVGGFPIPVNAFGIPVSDGNDLIPSNSDQGGNDDLRGLGGNDTLVGGAGSDVLNGGDGTDTAVFGGVVGGFAFERTPTGTIQIIDNVSLEEDEVISIEAFQFLDGTFTLAQVEAFADGLATPPNNIATAGDDILTDVANNAVLLDGLGGADQIFGLDLQDTLIGGAGDDIIDGGTGNDSITGGTGSDIIDGGAGGNDRAVFDFTLATTTFALTPTGALEVTNGADVDELTRIESLQFTDATVSLTAAENLIPDFQRGTAAAETLTGDAGAVVTDDTIRGLNGADTINGLAGDDVLLGDGGADVLNGGADRDVLAGGTGNDTVNGDADDDTIVWNAGDGRDVVNGGGNGGAGDTLEINGDALAVETFRIYTAVAAAAAGLNTGGAANEIVITRTVDGADDNDADRIILLRNVEELVINNRVIGAGTIDARGDVIEIIGDFTGTSLALNTITVNGSGGDDTVDISGLLSAHRVVFHSNGGNDTLIGDLRPQDIIELAPGTSPAGYTETDNGDGTTTMSNGSHSVTFSTGSHPTFAGGTGGSDAHPAAGDGFSFTADDVTELKKLVNGIPSSNSDSADAAGVRDLEGTGNNIAHPDYASADQPFIRITNAHYGAPDGNGNLSVNPIFSGLDPRTISNILGTQEADLAKNAAGANIFFMAFGQYIDHGLDFLPKGGNGSIAIGSGVDNPADLTRGTVAGYEDGVPQHNNKASPFVDQNQAYGSTELVGQLLRQGDSDGGVGARLLAGGVDPSNPDFRLLPTLRELIEHHWANNTVFTHDSLPGGSASFRSYYPDLVGSNGVINAAMVVGLNSDFMGSGHTLVGDSNPFVNILDHFVAGDLRANENYALTSIHTIWARNHNYHVDKLVAAGFEGTAEELFQAAKIVNEAEYQRVVFDEFADYLLGGMRGSGGHGHDEYNPTVNAGISHEFAAAVYRVGHSLIGQTITVLDDQGQPKSVPLFDAFLNPTNEAEAFTAPLPPGYVPQEGYEQIGVSNIIGGTITQQAEEVDFNVVDAVRNDLVRIRADLFAFNVARGWDVGLGTMNQIKADLLASIDPYVREAVELSGADLSPYESWEDFQSRNNLSDEVIAQFRLAYPDLVLQTAEDVAAFVAANPDIELQDGNKVKGIDRVDVWVGGLAEQHINGGMVGSTFWVVLHDQFDRLQEGDRFYYTDRIEGFDFYQQLEELNFSDIIARNTGLTDLPSDIFEARDFDPADDEEDATTGAGDDTGTDTNDGSGDDEDSDDTDNDTNAGNTDTNQGTGTGTGSGTGNDVIVPPLVLTGTSGANALLGAGGNDMLAGLEGDDVLMAGEGNNSASGGGGSDMIVAGAGSDVLLGDADGDTVLAGAGNDFVFGGAGDDRLYGQDGNDVIDAGAGRDVIDAGADDDRIIASRFDGDDVIEGGDGNDTLDLSAITDSLTIDLGGPGFGFLQSEQAGNDTLRSIENIIGGAGDDTIVAGGETNVLIGGIGEDSFVFRSMEAANGASIADFQPGDRIDITAIGANLGLGDTQPFSLVFDQGVFSAAGQVMFRHEQRADGEHTILEGNVDGDAAAEFSIDIVGRHNLTNANLVGAA